ncbi:MAG: DNA repair protein RecO [Chlorobi bacterium]|nr:DNA repair protein RecO [Chlorobiota bacterium]
MLVHTNAIVLRRIRYGDTSVIATLLTAERGIESVLAKGARSAKSRTAGLLQPLEELLVQYYVKPGRELHILRSAERVVLRRRVPSSYEHTLAAMAMVEIVLRLELPGHAVPDVFALLSSSLAALDRSDILPMMYPVAFAFRFAAAHGFQIGATEQMLGDRGFYRFRLDSGTFEQLSDADTGTVDWQTARAVVHLATMPIEQLSTVELAPSVVVQCQSLAERFLSYHFERAVRRSGLSQDSLNVP